MKPEQWNEGLNHLAPHLVEEYRSWAARIG